ncbi:MAG TPA: hypothetical protein VNA15_01090 [Candidatus Angelobacter sp.]|nr:hypothetical protein [Candidatus Angelobacter sp.]
MSDDLDWRLPGFGLVLGFFLAALLFSLGPGIAVGPSAFFGLTLLVVGIAIFILATPTDQLSSKLRAFSECTLIGVVWVLIALIITHYSKSTLALR